MAIPAATLEENLQLLYETAGMLGGDVPDDEVRYIIESPDLAQENLYLHFFPMAGVWQNREITSDSIRQSGRRPSPPNPLSQ